MIRRWCIPAILAAGLCGCGPYGEGFAPANGPPSEARTAKNARIAQLENDVRTRDRRIEELRIRADRLARRVRQLEFVNEQLTKQLAAIGDAPRQRDFYKQQAAACKLEIGNLRKQIESLQRALGLTTSRTATAPTRRPD